jgi:hypothetical protein
MVLKIPVVVGEQVGIKRLGEHCPNMLSRQYVGRSVHAWLLLLGFNIDGTDSKVMSKIMKIM